MTELNSSSEPPEWVTETIGEPAQSARMNGRKSTTGVSQSRSQGGKSNGTAGTVDGLAWTMTGGLSEAAIAWLEARGLDAEVASGLGIEAAISRDGGEWLAFPYRDETGVVVNRKYRCLADKRFTQDKGGRQCIWNIPALFDATLAGEPIVITEGEVDCCAAIQAGFARTVSVPGGAPSEPTRSDGKYAFLADTLDRLKGERDFIIAADGDGPGAALLHDLAMRIGRGRCRYVSYPAGCKDLGDVLRANGTGAVADCLKVARWCHVPGLALLHEMPPLPDPKPFESGFPGFYMLRKCDLCVTTGVPSSGKSTLWNDVACRMADRHGWRTCFGSFEQPPQTAHRRNLHRWFGKQPAGNESPAEYDAAEQWIREHFSFVVPPDDEDADLDWLLECMATAVIRYGADMVVIDPWNEVAHSYGRDRTLTQYVNDSLRMIKRFAAKYEVHMVICAHPAKMGRDKDGKTPKPTLYDISDSAAFFNKADVGLVIHPERDEIGRWSTQIDIQKSRYHDQIGKPGITHVVFNSHDGRYFAA